MALTAKKVYAILKRQISDMEAKLNSPVRYRGTVATADLLPLNPDIGDMYNIESKSIYGEAGMNVAWNGVVWDTMGAPIDMSLYLTKEEAERVIQRLVTEYFEKNPVKPGATTEQAQQIEQNKKDVASLKTDLSNKITKFYASNQGETHITDSDNGKIMDMMLYGKSSQDGTPTIDNPVEIESVVNPKVVVYGKNIAKKVTVVDEPQQYNTSLYIVADLRPSATYVLSFECASGYSGYINEKLFEQITFRGTGNRQRVVCKTKSALQSSELSEKGWRIAKNAPGNTIVPKFTNVMLERISASIAYEPYHEQTITLPCTLNAIPVSSGGNVVIDGQQYIADYVDVERGKVVRNVENVTFNGAENENWELWNADKEKICSFIFVNSLKTFTNESVSKCNRFEFNADESIDKTFWLCSPSGMPSLQIKNRIIGKDITAFKSWLSNNPINVIYPLRIPIEEELTAEHAQALKELATYYPVTNISIGSEQLDGYTVFNYPISIANGWNYVKKQLNDNRDYIYDMDIQSAEAYVNSEYAVVLTELEV